MGSLVWSIFKAVVWTLVALHALVTFLGWVLTIRTLGIASLRQCTRTFFISIRGWPVVTKMLLFCAPFVIIRFLNSLGVGPGQLNVFPVNALMLTTFMLVSLLVIPPTAVVFSSSTDRQIRWALALKLLARGCRVISLLDTGNMKSKGNIRDLWNRFARNAITLVDVLRTTEAENWQYLVEELIKVTPIVIVDTRVCTRALLFEASQVTTVEYAHKAIFVSEDDGSCPVLERLVTNGSVPPDFLVSIVKQDELGPILRTLVRSSRTLPQYGAFPAPPVQIGECVRGGLLPGPLFDSDKPAYDQNFTEADLTEETVRLSTRLTLPFKFAALVYWLSILMLFVFAPVVLEEESLSFIPKLSATAWVVILSVSFLTAFSSLYMIGQLRYVYLQGDYLLVADRGRAIKIRIFDIAHVSDPDWTGLRRITIHLHRPSGFGNKITFAPSLFYGKSIARYLRDVSQAYQEENTISHV